MRTRHRYPDTALFRQLQAHHRTIFPPEAEKTIRNFNSAETAKLLGIAEGYLRQLGAERGQPTKGNRRSYSVGDIADIRLQLDQGARSDRRYVPHRRAGEHLQVITVMNFKGGSGKTTTAAHLAQFLALHGYRTLAIALDKATSAPDEALRLAQAALRQAPDLVPALALAARLLARKGDLRKAAKLIEKAWPRVPHPDLAAVYLDLRPGDSSFDRLAKAQTLMRIAPRAPESPGTRSRRWRCRGS